MSVACGPAEHEASERDSQAQTKARKFAWLKFRRKELRKDAFVKGRDLYINTQAAICIQRWWRLEIVGAF